MKSETKPFTSEADLVSVFCAEVERLNEVYRPRNAILRPGQRREPIWTIYHETADWDLLLVDLETGVQIGLEAKLTVNAKVIEQALPDAGIFDPNEGPDYRGVLVPSNGLQLGMKKIAGHLGLTVVSVSRSKVWGDRYDIRVAPSRLPDENEGGSYGWGVKGWFPWLPVKRCALPDYLPDVQGGKAAPVKLTDWKIRAIKLLIVLERRGHVTRADMRFLKISETRWTQASFGFLAPDRDKGGYVRWSRTPDLKAQHPANWAQIEADFAKWAPADLKP